RSRMLAGQGQLEAASAALTQALTADSKFLPALYFRAGISVSRGNYPEAKRDLQQVLARDGANIPAYLMLAQIAQNEDHHPEVLSVLGKAIKAAPRDPTPRLALAHYQLI